MRCAGCIVHSGCCVLTDSISYGPPSFIVSQTVTQRVRSSVVKRVTTGFLNCTGVSSGVMIHPFLSGNPVDEIWFGSCQENNTFLIALRQVRWRAVCNGVEPLFRSKPRDLGEFLAPNFTIVWRMVLSCSRFLPSVKVRVHKDINEWFLSPESLPRRLKAVVEWYHITPNGPRMGCLCVWRQMSILLDKLHKLTDYFLS